MSGQEVVKHTNLIVVGAGFSGIGLGAMLKRQGNHDFVILERALGVGGTWRENTYPGIACDVPSQVYSYSFAQNPNWTRMFPSGAEIHEYLRRVADDEGVSRHIRFGADVERMWWNENDDIWVCETPAGKFSADVLVLACGRLSEPLFPSVPGLQTFSDGDPGRVAMHSARWRHDVDLAGKRVAVVGSGASAIQLVPEVANLAEHLTVLQRSAPYIVPRNDRPFTDSERRMFRRLPETMTEARRAWFWQQENVFAQRALVESEVETARIRALAHLDAQVTDPKVKRQLTPNYEIGCKRVLLSDTYYSTFSRPNVTLVDSALRAVEPGVLMTKDGTRVAADIAIFATGFKSAQQPYAHRVFGEGGISLASEWADGMYGHASIAVPGFPNLFVMNGPNSGLGHNSAIVMIETQIEYVKQALAFMNDSGRSVLRVRREQAEQYRSMIDEMSAETVWMRGGCESWYKDSRNGRLTLLWPGTTMSFREVAGRFTSDSYEPEMASV